MSQKYWDDLIAEGKGLTLVAEGVARTLVVPVHEEDRMGVRRLAQLYRASVDDHRERKLHRAEHQLQDVIDAYRWMYPRASRLIGPRGVPVVRRAR